MSEDKKIIIDEDWKSQVEREKEELEKKADDSGDQQGFGPNEIPPASFPMLITSIGTQAMMALGQVADPASGQAIYHPELARHHIDTLVVLQEKTKGNLSDDEQEMLDNFVTQLRQLFVATANAQAQAPPDPGLQL